MQLVARTHIILLLQFSTGIAEEVLEHMNSCMGQHDTSKTAGEGKKESSAEMLLSEGLPLGLSTVCHADFWLRLMKAAISSLPLESSRRGQIRSLAWRLVDPEGKEIILCPAGLHKPENPD